MSQFESQFEEKFYNERREKLAQIAALGARSGLSAAEATYPNHFRFSPEGIDIPAIRAQYDGLSAEQLEADKPAVAIAGRVVAIRLQGKAGFAQLQQGGQRLQIYVRKDNVGEDAFELYRLLDLGDHIGVEGTLFRTRTNELTIQVAKLTFLSKAMLPLPDKYSGLGDIELRYRRRYLDLFTDTGEQPELPSTETATDLSSRPESSQPHREDAAERPAVVAAPTLTRLPAREVFIKRARILRAIRKFFDDRGYLEVETPMLHTIAGGAAARTFTTHHNAEDMKLLLRIAPELHLKRLVVGGLDRVYEINRNFRNEGVDTTHNPEFTMLEFYQAYSNYHDLMNLTEELIKAVAMEVNRTTITHFEGTEIDLSKWTKLSMREAVGRWWPDPATLPTHNAFESVDGMEAWIDTFGIAKDFELHPGKKTDDYAEGLAEFAVLVDREPTIAEAADRQLSNLMAQTELHGPTKLTVLYEFTKVIKGQQPFGKAIAAIFEAVAEPHLIQPTIIYDFPLAVSPLSKIKPDEPEWVERFEFYIAGMEVGNAFSELNDPDDQRNRFLAQVADKDPESMAEVDEDYVRALSIGLPPTAGEGIGIDRLTMILTGSRSIRDVILFPLMRPHARTLAESAEATGPHGESAE